MNTTIAMIATAALLGSGEPEAKKVTEEDFDRLVSSWCEDYGQECIEDANRLKAEFLILCSEPAVNEDPDACKAILLELAFSGF